MPQDKDGMAWSHSLAFAVTHVRFPDGKIEEPKPKTFLFYESTDKTVDGKIIIHPDVSYLDLAAYFKKGIGVEYGIKIEIAHEIHTFFMLLKDYIVPYKNYLVQIAFVKRLNAKQKYIETRGIYKLLSDIIVKKGVCNDWIPVSFIKDISLNKFEIHWDFYSWASMFIRGNINEILTYPDKKKSGYTLGNIPKCVTNFPGQVDY